MLQTDQLNKAYLITNYMMKFFRMFPFEILLLVCQIEVNEAKKHRILILSTSIPPRTNLPKICGNHVAHPV